jgi:EAL domain-containing protein (putative c-di-GMP-specific phosphodiesterase class I)
LTRSFMDSVLDREEITVVFQPTFELNGSGGRAPGVHFLECLSRGPKGTNMESAGILFEYARRKGKEAALDRLCIETAFRAVGGLQERLTVSMNVHASGLEREHDFPGFFGRLAEEHGVSLSNVILEIVEHTPDWSGSTFLLVLEKLRKLGVRIALDDIGMGRSNYRMILDFRPNYFKIDRFLVQGCHRDLNRRAVLESLILLADRTGAYVVAEGVETDEDLFEIRRLGINLVQGFLLARPVALPEIRRSMEEGMNRLRQPAIFEEGR